MQAASIGHCRFDYLCFDCLSNDTNLESKSHKKKEKRSETVYRTPKDELLNYTCT